LDADGECKCDGAGKATVDPFTGLCGCDYNEHLTTDGCKTCEDAIPDCNSCSTTSTKTQIALADDRLVATGQYLECSSCPSGTHILETVDEVVEVVDDLGYVWTAGVDPLSACTPCGEQLEYCMSCSLVTWGQNPGPQCEECEEGYYLPDGGYCESCGYLALHCGRCRSAADGCDACADGWHSAYFLDTFYCERDWW